MIVKVQANKEKTALLVYNEDRSYIREYYHTDGIKEILNIMNGRPKVFFEATVLVECTIQLDQEIPEQNW